MTKTKIGRIFFGVNLFVMAWLISGCSDPVTPTGRYWNVVMAGQSTATITFGTPISPDRVGVIAGGSTETFNTSNYNLLIASGNTTTTPCRWVDGGGTVVVAPGGQTGTINLTNTNGGTCVGHMTSNLEIILGNSVAGILDIHNNYIVQPGRSVTATIIAPGSTGASSGNITY